jgi:hypothetical protein
VCKRKGDRKVALSVDIMLADRAQRQAAGKPAGRSLPLAAGRDPQKSLQTGHALIVLPDDFL